MEIAIYILLAYIANILICRYLNLYLIKMKFWETRQTQIWFIPIFGPVFFLLSSMIETGNYIFDEIQYKWENLNINNKWYLRWFLGEHWNK